MSLRDTLGAERYSQLLRNSAVCVGNTARLCSALTRRQLRIAFLGGSVTAGCLDNQLVVDCYPKLVTDGLEAIFPVKPALMNCGMAGTAADYGLVMAEQRCRSWAPGLVVVEYALNQSKSHRGMDQFESLVRKLLAFPEKPAVMLLLLTEQSGYTCEPFMLDVARRYGLPVISLASPLEEWIAAGWLSWPDYAEDGIHPSLAGHRLIADCILQFLARVPYQSEEPGPLSPEVEFGRGWEQLRLLDFQNRNAVVTDFLPDRDAAGNLVLCNNPAGPVHRFSVTLTCSRVLAVYVQHNQRSFGTVVCEIDGQKKGELRGYSMFGWHNPVTEVLLDTQETAEHTITLRMAEDEAEQEFHLLALGWCG